MKYAFSVVFVLIVMVSCKHNKDNKQANGVISMNTPKKSVIELKKEVYYGSVDAYFSLRTIYLDSAPEEFLYWALLMANKNDCPQAYFDVFSTTVDAYIGGDVSRFKEIDKRTQEFLINYLTIASKKGIEEADTILSKLTKEKLY